MGVPGSDMHAADQSATDSLLNALKTIDPSNRSRHASVLDYWLSIRGDREFPPLHDLDPLKLSDAGPGSALLELIGGGEDAEIRHLGETLKMDVTVERIIDAPSPSILSCIAKKLSIVAISRNYLAFEDQFLTADSVTRCWVTLLPLSSAGAWVDYVYAFVTFDTVAAEAIVETNVEAAPEILLDTAAAPEPDFVANDVEEATAIPPIDSEEVEPVMEDAEQAAEVTPDSVEPAPPELELETVVAPELDPEPTAEPEPEPALETAAGFAELNLANVSPDGFYGSQTVKLAPNRQPVPMAQAPAAPAPSEEAKPAEPALASDGSLQAKLAAARAKADDARMAKLASNAALYEGLGAAYDFALDAEDNAEEYLKIVEAHGLKIKLRQPMQPVMKLAFDGMCDDATIARLEAVLAWAFDNELPRGSLAAQIEAAGGIARILGGASPK
ncbi:hypothetical protein [Sphingomonas sp.]|uniref:hypothetical protein n=1 Tax=Sphingomonas sp. TaxID=28214 RepID=UPI00286A9F53|nr:hypothetical protein [Sphingomonas sp.]